MPAFELAVARFSSRVNGKPINAGMVCAGIDDNIMVGEWDGGYDRQIRPLGCSRRRAGERDRVRSQRRQIKVLNRVGPVRIRIDVKEKLIGAVQFDQVNLRSLGKDGFAV